ncbi:MAG: PPOX class F420-dependent oxidoreductase [Chloroflexi bacterium]|nr:PPOX class F420-dependent oxidoreductase [Chloroflexota bacterium]
MAALPQKVQDFLRQPNFGFLASVLPDGSPHVTAVWVDTDGQHVLVNTSEGRQKELNLRREPRVAISVVDPKNPYDQVIIRGRVAEITIEGADEHIDRMAEKYIGQERYPWRQPGEQRVLVKIVPEHVTGGS